MTDELYPIVKTFQKSESLTTLLCQGPAHDKQQVVQKILSESLSEKIPDLVDGQLAALSRLAHPNLSLVLDYGWQEGQGFLIREFVSGQSLGELATSLSQEEILQLFYQLFLALEYLHFQNVFCLNLKIENLWVQKDSSNQLKLKLTDFGLIPILKTAKQDIKFTPPPVNSKGDHSLPGPLPTRERGQEVDIQDLGKLLNTLITKPASEALKTFLQRLQKPNAKSPFMTTELRRRLGKLVGISQEPWNPPFDQVFRKKDYEKLVRNLLIQGQGWSIKGSAGQGKNYLSHYLQKYFLINGRLVQHWDGSNLTLLEGERIASPLESASIIIDHADQAPAQAWLGNRAYQTIILLGEEHCGVKGDSRWKEFSLDDLSEKIPARKPPSFSESGQKVYNFLAKTGVLWRVQELEQVLKIKSAHWRKELLDQVPSGWIQRFVWRGEEFFEAGPPPKPLPQGERGQIQALFDHQWYEAGLRLIDPTNKDFGNIIFHAKFLSQTENHSAAIKLLNTPFLKSLSDPAQQAEAFLCLGIAFLAIKKKNSAAKALSQALKVFQANQDVFGQIRAHYNLGQLYFAAKDSKKALEHYGQALDLDDANSREGEIKLQIAKLYFEATDYERAQDFINQSIEASNASYRFSTLAEVYFEDAFMQWDLGHAEEAEGSLHEALNLALFKKHWCLQGKIYSLWAEIMITKEDTGSELERRREAVFAYGKSGNWVAYGQAINQLAYFYEDHRQTELAQIWLKEALKIAKEQKSSKLLAGASLIMAKLKNRDIEKRGEAGKLFVRAQKHFIKSGPSPWAWEADFALAEQAQNEGKTLEAKAFFEQARQNIESYTILLSQSQRQSFLQDGKLDKIRVTVHS